MFLRRRTFKKCVWVILVGWTLGFSFSAMGLCVNGHDHTAYQRIAQTPTDAGGVGREEAPTDNEPCLLPDDQLSNCQDVTDLVDSGLSAALIDTPSFYVPVFVDDAAPVAVQDPVIIFSSLPEYFAVHRLRI